jgi:hypothetical protein
MMLAAQVLNNISWIPTVCVIGFSISVLTIPAILRFIPKDK